MDRRIECDVTQDLLLSYVDDVLNTESKKIVERHLLECKECQTKFNNIKSDIEKNDNNQQKQIDYLKKLRRKNNIKAIMLAIGIIFSICLIIYLRKFIIVNNFMNKADKSLSSENFYSETTQVISVDTTAVTKHWYKDGKYKIETEIYSDKGVEKWPVEYASINTNERIILDHKNKIATIEQGQFSKVQNKEDYIKSTQFGYGQDSSLIYKMIKAFCCSIHTSYKEVGKECYVLNLIIDQYSNYEEWIDKETGLPIKLSGNGTIQSFYEGTDIVKEEIESCTRYKYEFDLVTDEDVTVPDYSGYEIVYKNTDYK